MAAALIMLLLSLIAAVAALVTPDSGVITLIQYIALGAGYFLVWDFLREERHRENARR